jgi:2'-5' RNA ligase
MDSARMYFMALVLPEEQAEMVHRLKLYMLKEYGCRVSLKSPAHITLIPPFWMDTGLEVELLKSVQEFNQGFPSLIIQTDNFSCFKPRTLFVAVQPNELLDALKVIADAFFGSHPVLKIKTDTRPFHPHITIANRDLSKKSFAEAWPYFQQQTFQETMTIERLSLLRHNGQVWEIIR